MTDLVVAKFGGTSVADFDAMNRSIDVALLDANTRIVVLSASAGVTNILVALAGGLEPTERFSQLDALRQIQFNILERLRYPNVIREEIERLLENITTLAEAAALAFSTALTDELVSHGELMSPCCLWKFCVNAVFRRSGLTPVKCCALTIALAAPNRTSPPSPN